ncbi:MAG: ABC transporter ATP-binding protein [Alphaproteobacteria bacterium]|nr:ABC transporter ATP-binding protein [Alphaproteobacteria bacterium]
MRWPFARSAERPSTEGPALVARGLVKRFGAVTALAGLDLSIPRGELYGLVGPDGAGKTTAVRAFAGLLDPDAGEVRLLGLDPRSSAARESVGLMPQRYALYGDLTIDENLAFFGDLFDIPKPEFARRRERLMHITRLGRFGDRRADALSGGMYKKLALACALLHEPPVLLLDEPTNGVDPVSRRELWALLHEFVEQGSTIVVTTPYMDEAERCHRVGVLHEGRLLAEGDPVVWAREHGSFEAFFIQALEAA